MNSPEWLARAFELGDGSDRLVVPEHAVKEMLRELGVVVPTGGGVDMAGDLRAPLVLKAWGPGIVHKRDVGAVRVGLEHDALPAAVETMERDLARHGVARAGFFVEEQAPEGVELRIGVVERPGFGLIAVLGIGGTFTEIVDQQVARLVPLSPSDARAMLDELPASALLDGARGGASVDRGAVLALLLALAGERGLATQLAPRLSELECNPIIVTTNGAIAVDARLILTREATAEPEPRSHTDFTRLFAPRAIAVAGASTSKVTFGNRFLAAYRDVGWTDHLVAIHPSAVEIDGVAAFPTAADVPGGVDYLLVAVPAAQCAGVVTGARDHAAFAHVISGGFGEAGPEGEQLEHGLLTAARNAGLRLLGPNCLGVFAPKGRQTFQLGAPTEVGTVSVISQSGGLAGDIVKAGDRRGLRFSKLVTVGNAIDVGPAELLEYLVDDTDTEVIGLYLEGTGAGTRLVDALRRAAGHKPVVVLAAGSTAQGSAAVASHTGAMTGERRSWEAVAASTGVAVVTTLEDLLAVLAFAQAHAHTRTAASAAVLVAGPGGGASVLAADACDRHGLRLVTVDHDVQAQLRALGYGDGTSVANPLELPLGPATAPDAFERALTPVLGTHAFSDVLLHVNVQSYFSYGDTGAEPLLALLERVGTSDWSGCRASLVLRNLDCAPTHELSAVLDAVAAMSLPVTRTFDEAALGISAMQHFARFRDAELP